MNRDERRAFVRGHRTAVFGYNRRREGRVVVRLTPYATFHSPPKHVHQASDVSEKLAHGLGDSLPW